MVVVAIYVTMSGSINVIMCHLLFWRIWQRELVQFEEGASEQVSMSINDSRFYHSHMCTYINIANAVEKEHRQLLVRWISIDEVTLPPRVGRLAVECLVAPIPATSYMFSTLLSSVLLNRVPPYGAWTNKPFLLSNYTSFEPTVLWIDSVSNMKSMVIQC